MKKLMRIVSYLTLIFLISSGLQAQSWSGVQPLIPSQDNSTNLNLNCLMMVWEHQVDSATTAIYIRSTLPGSDTICLAQTVGVKYSKPEAFLSSPNHLVLFETNENGNSDIYGIIVDSQGNAVSEIQPIVSSEADEHSIDYSANYAFLPNLAWIADGILKAGMFDQSNNLFSLSGIAIVDTGNCSNPTWWGMGMPLYWIKCTDSMQFLRYSEFENSAWNEPENLDIATNMTGLNSCNRIFPIISISSNNDSTWVMKDFVFDYGQQTPEIIIPEVYQDHSFDFDAHYFLPGVKSVSETWEGSIFQAFANNTGDHDEIFLNENSFDPNAYINFSNLGVNCRNPQFFEGEVIGSSAFNFYLTWESFIDNSWQIYYSITPYSVGDIVENEPSPVSNIVVIPNPFSDRLDISFDLEKSMPVTVDLLDVHGRVLMNLVSETCTEGSFSRPFDLTGFPVQSGLFFIRFGVDGKYSFKKVVKGR